MRTEKHIFLAFGALKSPIIASTCGRGSETIHFNLSGGFFCIVLRVERGMRGKEFAHVTPDEKEPNAFAGRPSGNIRVDDAMRDRTPGAKTLALFASAMLLEGCAQQYAPMHGQSVEQQAGDRLYCRQVAEGVTPPLQGGGFYAQGSPQFVSSAATGYAVGSLVAGIAHGAQVAANYGDCMVSHGYAQAVAGSPPAPARSPPAPPSPPARASGLPSTVSPISHPVRFSNVPDPGDYVTNMTLDTTQGDKSARVNRVARFHVRSVQGGAREVVATTTATTTPGNKIETQTLTTHVTADGSVKVLAASENGRPTDASEFTTTATMLAKDFDLSRTYRQGDTVLSVDLPSRYGFEDPGAPSSAALFTCRLAGETVLHGGPAAVLDCTGNVSLPKGSVESSGYMAISEQAAMFGGQGDMDVRMVIRVPSEPTITMVMRSTGGPEE
jgi:hypothetical protein